ncbi:MAG: hypothetical protein KC549_13245, partial [Myxococcales bacterium]|nr:hypothetical protein [Myxococcales bacterium]
DGCEAGPDDLGPTIGGDRPARVLLPAAYADDGPAWPLVLLLHGFGSNGAQQDSYLGVSAQRDAAGFIVVVPDGTVDPEGDRFWNATPACCDDFGSGVDDVAYLTGLLDEAQATYRVDPARIYLVGHSNGAFMSYRLACTLGDRIAGLVALAGSTVLDEADCAAMAPISVLHIHAEDDGTVPYAGIDRPVDGYPGAVETAARWAARAGCGAAPAAGDPLDLVASVPGDETSVATYPGCVDAQVALWTLSAGGHVPAFGARFAETALPWLLAQ